MKKIYPLAFLIIASLFVLFHQADAAGLCKEEIGAYYVNIGIINDTFGVGLDDVFNVYIKRILPKTEVEVNKLKEFNYFDGKDEDGNSYQDGRKYFWKEEHNGFRLYKEIPGRKPVRVELFAAVFSPEKKAIYHLKLLQSNPRIYRENALDSGLDYLGVMGVTFRGREGTIDFINNKRFPKSADAQFPQVTVSNADTMLYRYALDKRYLGTTLIVTGDEIQGAKGFETLLRRKGEQTVLDNRKVLLEARAMTDDMSTILTFIGGKGHQCKISGGISNIKLIYVPCVPEGNNVYGAPKAVFVPVKEASSSDYPIFVFPTAFSRFEVLETEIKRELYHAQWWNAVTNISGSDGNFYSLKEGLLRYTVPYLEADIFGRMKAFTMGAINVSEMYFSHRSLFYSAALSAMSHPERTDYLLPWTISNNLINPMPTRRGDNYYNKVVTKLTDINSFGWESDSKLLGKMRNILYLLEAIVEGYARSAEDRNMLLSAALDSASYVESINGLKQYMPPDWSWVGDNSAASLELIEKLKKDAFHFSDLGWLRWCIRSKFSGPLKDLEKDLFGKRLSYLIDTKKVTAIEGLDLAAEAPITIDKIVDLGMQEQVLGFVTSGMKKAEKYLGELREDKEKNETEKEKIRKEIEDLQAKLEDFKRDFERAKSELVKASDDYNVELEKFKMTINEKYKKMQDVCSTTEIKFKPDRDEDIQSMIDLAPVKTDPCLDAIEAYCIYRVGGGDQTLWKAKELKEKKSDAVRLKEIEGNVLISSLSVLTASSIGSTTTGEILDKEIRKGIESIEETMNQRNYPWKKWLKEALVEYFTKSPNKSDEEAYTELEKKVLIVPFVKIIKKEGGSR